MEPSEQTPSSQLEMFLHAFQLDGRGGVTAITDPAERGQPQWFHLDYSDPEAENTLTALGIDAAAVESLIRTDTRPRSIHFDQGLLLSLRAININPGADPEDMVSLRIWIESDRIVTIRQRRVFSVQEVLHLLEAGRGPRDLGELVLQIIEGLTERAALFVDRLEERMDQLEALSETGRPAELRGQVAALRRQAASVRRYLAPQRDAMEQFSRIIRQYMAEEQTFRVRELSDRLTRYVEDLDLLREQAIVLQEQLLNMIAEQQNSRMYVLAIITAVFLPITFLTGVFGMNVGGLPGTDTRLGFAAVAVITISTVVLVLSLLKWKRWF
ncbi:MAG: zinc transporter ZntB [Gammaproteobacteria bacterium]|nr:zinc transporter ZntB [Gammaproteobacteria bacterium]